MRGGCSVPSGCIIWRGVCMSSGRAIENCVGGGCSCIGHGGSVGQIGGNECTYDKATSFPTVDACGKGMHVLMWGLGGAPVAREGRPGLVCQPSPPLGVLSSVGAELVVL